MADFILPQMPVNLRKYSKEVCSLMIPSAKTLLKKFYHFSPFFLTFKSILAMENVITVFLLEACLLVTFSVVHSRDDLVVPISVCRSSPEFI